MLIDNYFVVLLGYQGLSWAMSELVLQLIVEVGSRMEEDLHASKKGNLE